MQLAQRRRLASTSLAVVKPGCQPDSSASANAVVATPQHQRVDCWARQASPPRHGVPTDVLTEEQLQQWDRDGCLLVSGLLTEQVAERADS